MNSKIHKKEQRPKINLLHRVTRGLHTVFSRKPHGTSYIQSKEIYEAADVPERTFKRNFYGADDVMYYAFEEISDVFDEIAFTPEKSPNLQNCLEMLLLKLRQHEDALRVVLDRSDLIFWQETLAIIRPLIVYDWNHFTNQAINLAYSAFVALFVDIIMQWKETDFSKETVNSYVQRLLHNSTEIKNNHNYWNLSAEK